MTVFSRKSNKNSQASYQDVEKLVSASQHPAKDASQQFKKDLLSELRTKQFSENKVMEIEQQAGKEKKEKRGKLWESNKIHFAFPMSVPIVVGVLVFAIIITSFLVFDTDNTQLAVTNTNGPLVIDQFVSADEIDGAFELVALDQNGMGINPGTTFQLTAKIDTTIEKIRESLSFSPAIAYAIEPTSANTYRITPNDPLSAGSIVVSSMKVQYKDESGAVLQKNFSWTYQVQEEFQVVSTLPRNRATGVPRDSGIEFELSHVGYEAVEENFSITPAVTGRFEYHRKTAVFVPNEKLAAGTIYTVKIGKDIKLTAEDKTETLNSDYEFQFETDEAGNTGNGKGIGRIQQITNETSSQEQPVFLVTGSNLDKVSETEMSIYKFPDLETYTQALYSYTSIPGWAYGSLQSWDYDASSLEYYSSSTAAVQSIGDYWQYAVTAPDTLPVGYYLIQLAGRENANPQALLQVSDITAYVTTSETDTVVWAHNAITKQPLSGAEVSTAEGDLLGKTNDKGVLQVQTPDAFSGAKVGAKNAVVIAAAGSILYLPLSGNAQGYGDYYYDESFNNTYWSYLYVDQPFYQPDATVNYWGLIDPRDSSSISIATIQLREGYGRSSDQHILYEQEIKLGKFGTFEGSLELGNLLPEGYFLSVSIDDEILFSKYINVMTYVKPAYALDISPANIGLIQGETYTHTVQAEFFDGTPVAALDLNIGGETHRTDESGVVQYTHTYGSFYDENEARERTDEIYVNPVMSEEGEISTWARVRVFPSSQTIDLDSTTDGNKAIINGTVYQLDLDRFNGGDIDFYDDAYGAVVSGQKVELKVTRAWYKKKENGTRYDYINKVARPVYTYKYKTEDISTNELTANAQGEFTFDFDMLEGSTYTVIAKATDDSGRTTTEMSYASVWDNPNSVYSDSDNFYLSYLGENTGDDYVSYSQRDFSINEKVAVEFYRGDEKLPSSDYDTFMYIQAQNGIRQAETKQDATYEFTFTEEHIPNVVLQGIWFDGRSYWASDYQTRMFDQGFVASFSEEDRDMDIAVTTDKQNYQPGDEVVMDLQVTRADGKTDESVVNVNLIDEAVYAIMPERGMSFLSEDYSQGFNAVLYRDVASGIITSYASHRYPVKSLGVEGGGGWDSRSNFSDKALFQTVTTDKHGKAQVKFTLPDNITSWRITTHAYDEDRFAGSDVSKLTVTQPFFVTAVVNDTYLVDDQPIIKIRAYGEELQQDSAVSITWKSESLGIAEASIGTAGSTAIEVPLSNLTIGQHTIEVKAESGEHSDAVARSFEVLPSRLAIASAETHDLSVGWAPNIDTERNYQVVLSDKHIGQFYSDLWSKLYTHGDRLDQQVARMTAANLLNQYFDAGIKQGEFNAAEYQIQESGALALFPYSDHDLMLSAHVAASDMASEFDKTLLAQYFESVLNDKTQTTLRHSIALYGLAGLQEPVLYEIREVLNYSEITDVDRLFLTLALAELGSIDEAKILYQGFQNKYGREHDQYKYLELGDETDFILENTMTMAIIGALVQDADADAYFNYVRDNWTKEILLLVPEVNFMEARMNVLPQSAVTITYKLDKQQHTVELANGETETIALTPATSASFGIIALEGEAKATVNYLRKATDEELNLDDRLTISRSYESTTLSDGELVKITVHPQLAVDAPDGVYQVTDYVPSGMKIVTQPYKYERYAWGQNVHYPYRIDGQRVSFSIWKREADLTFTYYARVTNKGTFTAERPVIQAANSPSVRAAGSEEIVVIE